MMNLDEREADYDVTRQLADLTRAFDAMRAATDARLAALEAAVFTSGPRQ